MELLRRLDGNPRGRVMKFAGLTGSPQVGPIVSGAMTERLGWRSFWWLNVALYGAMIVFQLFLHPETHYDRRNISDSNKPTEPSDSSFSEKPAVVLSDGTNSPKDNVDEHFGKGAPSRSQFMSVTRKASGKEALLTFWIPVKLFSFPIVEWTSFALSWSAAVFLLTNLTQSQAFAAPPYNMSSTSVGAYFCHTDGGEAGGEAKFGINERAAQASLVVHCLLRLTPSLSS
jgi:MFS family permease